MKKHIVVSALTLLIFACAVTQDGKEHANTLASVNFNYLVRIHCLERAPLSEETQTHFRVKVSQSGENPLQICYQISDYERCFDTYLNYTYTECRETIPPYKHCHDDRVDGNEVWKIYNTASGDTLMLGNKIFVSITGEGCFAAFKR